MTFIDIVILIVLLWGAIKGWRSGFLKQLASFAGFFVGLIIAYSLYSAFGDFLAPRLGSSAIAARILAFLILWIGVPIGLGVVATMLTKATHTIHIGWLNSGGGALLGIIKYALLLSCLLNVMSFTGMVSEQKQQESALFNPIKGFVSAFYHSFDTKPANSNGADSTNVAQQ
jgi:membrane protein required for colicin V production